MILYKIEKDKNYKNYIVPGFVDLHCHGGNGYDCMEGLDSIKDMSSYQGAQFKKTFLNAKRLNTLLAKTALQ